ncbi:hypothetical protein TWF718_007779 [Orbilia javanica]|uniref:Heterokaryon incompatibility domain-containing protein n=1 Tax=Orbilia javanica TaxID=47235 RepID=A0AAN8MRP9_9PEZI
MSDDRESMEWYSRLEPPRNPTRQPRFITFRAPDNEIYNARCAAITDEISKQEEKKNIAKEKRAVVWEDCRRQLDDLGKNAPGEVKTLADALARAMTKERKPGMTDKERARSELAVIEGRLKAVDQYLEIANQPFDEKKLKEKIEARLQETKKRDGKVKSREQEVKEIWRTMDDILTPRADRTVNDPLKLWDRWRLGGGKNIEVPELVVPKEGMDEKGEEEDRGEGGGGNEEHKNKGYGYDQQATGEITWWGEYEKEVVIGLEVEGKDGEGEEQSTESHPKTNGIIIPTGWLPENHEPTGRLGGFSEEPGLISPTEESKQGGLKVPTPPRQNRKHSLSSDVESEDNMQEMGDEEKIQLKITNAKDRKRNEIKRMYNKRRVLEDKKKKLLREVEMLDEEYRTKMDAAEDRQSDNKWQTEFKEQRNRKDEFEEMRQTWERDWKAFKKDDFRIHRTEIVREADVPNGKSTVPRLLNKTTEYKYLEHVHNEDKLNRRQKALKKMEELEAEFTKVIEVKREVNELKDLITVLYREKAVEGDINDSFKQPPPRTRGKQQSHVSGARPKYDKLEIGQIRVLTIWPTEYVQYPLICSLETHPLQADVSKPLDYAALSYFWGPETPTAHLYLRQGGYNSPPLNESNWGSIALRSKRISIRANLFRALLRLRDTKKPVKLWVDFLCIDQDNAKEKTSQLREMVKIYRTADSVCVWLGEPDKYGRISKAMNFIKTIKDFAMLDTYVKDAHRAEEWLAISELMRDRWFSRRWVVQEIALAKKATIRCGPNEVQWHDFVDAVSILVSNQANIRKLFHTRLWRDGPNTLGDVQFFGANVLIKELSTLFWRAEDGTIIRPIKSLESLVTSLRTFDTSDKRDLIYSLAFIAADTFRYFKFDLVHETRSDQETNPERFAFVKDFINYEKNTADVYKDFVSFCIEAGRQKNKYPLDIICRPWAMREEPSKANDKASNYTLPSWIALLSNSVFGEPEQIYKGRKNGESLVGPAGQPKYWASGDRKPTAKFELEDGEYLSKSLHSLNEGTSSSTGGPRPFPWSLAVSGFVLARVNEVSPRNNGGLILQESLRMGGWDGIENLGEEDFVPDRVWRTLVANKDATGQVPPTWYQKACLRCLEIADNFNGGDLNVCQLLQSCSGMMETYLKRVRSAVWNRSFFKATTIRFDFRDQPVLQPAQGASNGVQKGPSNAERDEVDNPYSNLEDISEGNSHDDPLLLPVPDFFGLCPGDTQPGDLVCIIYGCSVPVILRRVSKTDTYNGQFPHPMPTLIHRIIGEAYVHGKMDGGAIDGYKTRIAWEPEQEFKLV